jgi:hypothetical protein
MGRHREIVTVERQFVNRFQVELGVKTQTCTGVGNWVIGFRNGEFARKQSLGFWAGAIRQAHKTHALIIHLGGQNQRLAGFGLDMVWEMAPNDVTGHGHGPYRHAGLSISNKLLLNVPPLAFSADF